MNQLKKNKTLLFIIGFLLLTNIALLVFCFMKEKPDERNKQQTGRFTTALQKDVGFSSEQMKEFEKLKKINMDQVRPLFNGVKNAKLDFYALLYDSTLTDSLLDQQSASIGEKQKNLDLQMFRNFKKIRRICTHDQLPKFDTAVKQLVRRMVSRSDRPQKNKKK